MLPPRPVGKRCPTCSSLLEKTVLSVTDTTVTVRWECALFGHTGEQTLPRTEKEAPDGPG